MHASELIEPPLVYLNVAELSLDVGQVNNEGPPTSKSSRLNVSGPMNLHGRGIRESLTPKTVNCYVDD